MIEHFVNLICSGATDKPALQQIAELASQTKPESIELLLQQLLQRSNELANAQIPAETAVKQLADQQSPLSTESIDLIRKLYQSVDSSNNIRNNLLYWVGNDGAEDSLRAWCDLITTAPPSNPHGLVQSFAPLIKRKEVPDWLFQQLAQQGIAHPEIASAALDLMNYHLRSGNVENHPAASRAEQLTTLLGSVVQQMARVEEGNLPPDLSPQEISERVSESVALTISLCDSLALMNYEPAIGKLSQALELRHRRIQTEAAAALARLDVEEGRQWLAKLAEEPIARMRVLAFAEELDILDEIPEELQSEIAVAESRLAMWLSEPTQMGIAPSEMELIDNRELYWPSYEHPLQCYLFRFRYGSDPVYSNLGIAGPATHVFDSNIESLSVDDAYAAFAGWQAIHPDIFQMSPQRGQEIHAEQIRDRQAQLDAQGYQQCEPVLVGRFFDEVVLAVEAIQDNAPVIALADDTDVCHFPIKSEKDPIDATMAYTIWRGRKLLAQFN